jgi:histidinol-phosphate/aromatic aminotransferase/cobyric acid decarboxylase-like protein
LGTAASIGAKSFRVPLTATYAHDVREMAKADASAGMFYVCNPNNPTGTLTSREDIEWLIANKPAGSVVVLDEAYIHLSKNAVPCSDLAAAGKDIVILRTFSKLYGMAGLRAGAAIGRPDLLHRLQRLGANVMPATGMVGAQASLKVKNLVAERRKLIAENREDVFEFLNKHNFEFVPSESNKFMVNVKRPGGEIVRAMATENVYIGRVWSAWPTWVRVSVGTHDEMAKFKAAFLKVMA